MFAVGWTRRTSPICSRPATSQAARVESGDAAEEDGTGQEHDRHRLAELVDVPRQLVDEQR